jgi:hypothetical protein
MYTAVIIEPRKHPAMKFVLNNFLDHLDERWNFIIFHGTENEEWVKQFQGPRITYVNLNVANLTTAEYSKFCTTSEFYEKIPTEMFLIFQTDTMICPSEKNLIYDFMKYDYVGAPFIYMGKVSVGNGGLSLRRKSKMLEIIHKYPYNGEPEDVYFSTKPLYKPSVEEAKLFSMESIYSERCFGIHKAWVFHQVDCELFPQLRNLVRLNDSKFMNLYQYKK